ncbi:MAG TPA: protein kinase, partial [Thermoanaerobaculia bacterium]|nr:protein kinase [Thermoanaerobaculia bacterium]
YRARDTRLDRIVAVKVLPAHLTASAASRARFEREARAISALSHPNICALYDVGREGDIEYLVMEYLEGQTLADLLARGPLPRSQFVKLGAQIAEALQHAHRAGIVHRDLKPGNIMITASGAKLLDFGLAKFADPVSAPLDQDETATRREPLTAEGMVVGTYQYMSPEQIEGRAVDHRTDIFSLGVILYEMATGRRPFSGATRTTLIASILSSDPISIRSLQPDSPPDLDRIIITALQKNPDERWQTAQDVALQLRWSGESSPAGIASTPPRRRTPFLIPLLLIAAAALLTFGVMRWLAGQHPTAAKSSLHLWLPPPMNPTRPYETGNFALSPDGRMLCFNAATGGMSALFLRALDSYAITKIEGTEGSSGAFWSSDGAWIAFSARGKLWKTKISGGAAPEALCDVSADGATGSWQGHTILFADAAGGRFQIFRVSDAGGEPAAVTQLRGKQWRHSWPRLLPDGEHFFYLAYLADSIDRQLIFASLKSPEQTAVLRNASMVRLAGDQLLFVRDAKLLSQHFDAARGTLTGDPVALASDVSYFYPTARADFDAAGGTLVYRTDTSVGRLALVNRSGAEIRVIDDKNVFYDFGLSPDGGKAAVSVVNRDTGFADIWIYDLVRGVRERFSSEPWHEVTPVWSPDGSYIVYSEAAGGTFPHIVRRGFNDAKPVDVSPRGPFQFAGSFTPDGQTLFYVREDARRQADIYRIDMRTKRSSPVLATDASEDSPVVSPDGQWLAYVADSTGSAQVYLMRIAGGDARPIRISPNGGNAPGWRRDGGEIVYRTSEGAIISAMPGRSGRWDDAATHELFRVPDLDRFAMLPDGQSFLLQRGSPGPSDAVYHVVLGFQ